MRTGTANFYVLRPGDDVVAVAVAVAVDGGCGTATIRREPARIGIEPDDVTHVLLTHADIDHVGGRRLFRNARLYMSAAERPLVQAKAAGTGHPDASTGSRRALFEDGDVVHVGFEDGDVVHVGTSSVRAVASLGLTLGSMSFLGDGTQLALRVSRMLCEVYVRNGRLVRATRLGPAAWKGVVRW